MGEIVCLVLCIMAIALLRIIFKISYRKAKELEENNELQKITDKFPENVEVAKEMLEMIHNNDVKIEQAKNTKTSLYIAITNKISIADLKDNYGRLQTIAHECMHSVQDKTLLMFNFVFSNIIIIYYIVAVILTVCKLFTNNIMQAFILLMLALIQFSVRGYLEIDAMTKSKYLAKEYIEKKGLCTEEEKNKLITEYDRINNMGIPFTLYYLLTNSLIKIIVFLIISILLNN